jgi:ribose transport system substrate-binding protein
MRIFIRLQNNNSGGKIMKRRLLALVLICLLVVTLAACGQNQPDATPTPVDTETEEPAQVEPAPEEPTQEEPTPEEPAQEETGEFDPLENPIAMSIFLRAHPVHQMMIAGFMSRAQELGYEPHLFSPDEVDAPMTHGMTESGIALFGIRGISIHNMDESTAHYIQRFADQGIAVVMGHTQIRPEDRDDFPGLLAYAAASAENIARDSAIKIGTEIDGQGTVAVTLGSFNHMEIFKSEVFTSTMNEMFPDVEVLEPVEEGFDLPTAIQRATAIAQANPDLVAAFSTTGGGPSTWAGAQRNIGRSLVVISKDYTRANLELVREGEIFAVVAQPLIEAWARTAELLDSHLRGETIEFSNVLDAPFVTIDNVDEFFELVERAEAAFAAIN